MKNLILLSFATILLLSCKSQKEKDMHFIKEDLLKSFDDASFKENSKIKIYTFDILNIDTLRRGFVDSVVGKNVNEIKFKEIEEILKRKSEEAKSSMNMLRLSVLADNSMMKDQYKTETNDLANEIKSYSDSLSEIIKHIEVIQKNASTYKNDDLVYEIKTFLKATVYKNKDSLNYSDTLFYYYDKGLKKINTEDYKWKHLN
jgi:hypothetical protein